MPDTTPTAAPAAPAPDTPAPEERHPGVSKLLDMLISDPESEKEPKPEIPPLPSAPVPKPAAPAPAPAADDKPIRGRQRPAPPAPTRPPLPIEATPAARPPAATPVPPASEVELEANERQAIEDAEYAERHLGAEYSGLGAKMKKFVRDNIAYSSGPDFDPESPEYREWLAANQPHVTPAQQRAIMEAQITERATATARSQVGKVEHELYVRDTEPVIRQEGAKVYGELAELALPKEVRDILSDPAYAKDQNAGWAEAKKYHQLEINTLHGVISAFKDDVEELDRISRKNPRNSQPMVQEANYAADPKFTQHQRLRNLVAQMCEDFKTSGESQQKNGRWFVTREELSKIPPAQRGQFWTLSNNDVVARAKTKIPATVNQAIKSQLAEQAARGFIRPARPAPTPPAAPPRPGPSAPPAPRPSAIPTSEPGSTVTAGGKLAAALNGIR